MTVLELDIPEVKLIIPDIHEDSRGYFFESFNDKEFKEKVCNTTFVQDNESCSVTGTVRGLHWQRPPFAQSKLVRVIKGAVYDVAVDIRKGSPTFGKFVGAYLSEHNHKQLFIPRGFAHGFCAIGYTGETNTIFQYKCDNFYNKASEAALAWDSCGIDWGHNLYNGEFILSEKDSHHPILETINKDYLFDYNINYYEE